MADARVSYSILTLSDGRRLAYLDLGDPDGFPLVSCHGGLSSALDVVPSDASAHDHNLRIIAADRPGIGSSDLRRRPRPSAVAARRFLLALL